jgi:hypothetical protein
MTGSQRLVRALPIAFHLRVGPSGGSSERRVADVELHRRAPRGGAQASIAACFFERGLHPTEESGQCRWRHRRLEPLARAFVQRELRCASVGAASRRELLGVRAGALRTSGSTPRCCTGGIRASGYRGRRAFRGTQWLPKRGEGRSRPEPSPTARPSWGGARALRRGGGVVGERRTLRRARGIELVSSSCCRREPGQPGRFQRRQRRRGGPDPGRHDEGHPPRVEVTCGRDLFRHDGQSSPGTARRW